MRHSKMTDRIFFMPTGGERLDVYADAAQEGKRHQTPEAVSVAEIPLAQAYGCVRNHPRRRGQGGIDDKNGTHERCDLKH